MRQTHKALLAFIPASLALGSTENIGSLGRAYTMGESYGYVLETTKSHNGNFESKMTAHANLQFVPGQGDVPYDEITWTSLQSKDSQGATIDLSKDARAIAAYQISLHPDGTLALPPLNVPSMVAMITDLNTYFVAVSGAIGISNMREPGDVYRHPKNHIGNWTNGNITLGQDCTESTLTFVSQTSQTATVKTEFLAPNEHCFEMPYSWMAPPVKSGTPNNIIQITKADDNSYTVIWGHEQFIVDTVLNRADGKIISATMNNTLTLKMKIGCDASLENCKKEFPLVIQRDENLKLSL